MLQISGAITVLPGRAAVKDGTFEGRDYTSTKVACFAEMPDGTGAAFMVSIPKGQEAPKPGQYTLGPDSLYVKDGKLSFSPKLAAPVSGGAKP